MKPSIGRIVHYVAYGSPGGEFPAGACRAAIVTQVDDDGKIGLAVYNPSGMWFNRHVQQDETDKKGGTWHWPERVEG